MTLIPIGRKLVSADARPLGRDAVVDAVLAVKRSRETPTPDLLDALRSVGPVAVDLVVTDRAWIDGRPVLTFAVEDYAPLDHVPDHLCRYAETAAGVWWSASKLDAWREGSGRQHRDRLPAHQGPVKGQLSPGSAACPGVVRGTVRPRYSSGYGLV